MPGRRSHFNLSMADATRSSFKPSLMGVSQWGCGKQGVVAGKIWLIESKSIEVRAPKAQRWWQWGNVATMTQDVLDVLSADMTRAHDFVDGGAEVLAAEDLDQ